MFLFNVRDFTLFEGQDAWLSALERWIFFPFHSPMVISLWVAMTTIKRDFPGLRATKSLWFFRYSLSNAPTVSRAQRKHKYFIAWRLERSGLCPLQVSVLTDQVEAQGEKIRDLDLCLDEHREKLNATEEMLQQVCLSGQAESFPPGVEQTFGSSC